VPDLLIQTALNVLQTHQAIFGMLKEFDNPFMKPEGLKHKNDFK
jgi:hypothetical protein